MSQGYFSLVINIEYVRGGMQKEPVRMCEDLLICALSNEQYFTFIAASSSKLKSNPANPAYTCVFQPKFQDAFEGNAERGPLGIRMKPRFENLGLDTSLVSQVDLQKFAFWDHQGPPVILDPAQHKRDTTSLAFYKSKYLEIRSRYDDLMI